MKKAMNLLIVGITGLSLQGIAFAQDAQDSKQDKSTPGSRDLKKSAHSSDTDSCKLTKQEWMDFMAAEFDRLANKSGQIDLSERSSGKEQTRPFSSFGK